MVLIDNLKNKIKGQLAVTFVSFIVLKQFISLRIVFSLANYWPSSRFAKHFSAGFCISKKVLAVLDRIVTQFGNSAKADIPKKYIGKRIYSII